MDGARAIGGRERSPPPASVIGSGYAARVSNVGCCGRDRERREVLRGDGRERARASLGWSMRQQARRMKTVPATRTVAAADSRITTVRLQGRRYRRASTAQVRFFAFYS